MKRVTGIGCVFFKAHDAEKLRAWYHDHLGIDAEGDGGFSFEWRDKDHPEEVGLTVLSVFRDDSTYTSNRVLCQFRLCLMACPDFSHPCRTMSLEKMSRNESDVYERLCRARRFIDLCYDLPLNLDQISSQACFSRYHFLRLFREAFAKTPHQYLVERRIEKAKELLSSRELRVTDICFEVGFQSLGSFSSLFHKYVGHAPITYREKTLAQKSARRQVPGCFLVMYKLDPPNELGA